MRRNTHPLAVVVLAIVLGAASWAGAGHLFHCAHCGCRLECQKVCRLEKDEKKVTIVCWGGKSEDFCDPGRSCRGCKNCEEVCETCDQGPDAEGVCSESKKFVWYDWIPGCSKGILTKNKLMKKTITKKLPSYKWVVEDLCPKCVQKSAQLEAPPGVKLPPLPITGTPVLYGRLDEQEVVSEEQLAPAQPPAPQPPVSSRPKMLDTISTLFKK